ncbi:MAG TPA: phage tail protein [Bryobacteraceae bacterium]|jgi:hypothetical protein|nr:phage tail protein [Bryobacteraceae bacterium]
METIVTLKERTTPGTPLFLFDITLASGQVERVSTHAVTYGGVNYSARVVQHNLFDLRASSDQGIDSLAKVSITLANADSIFSEIERNIGWKGAQAQIQFVFFDLVQQTALSESRILFWGVANPPEESTESTFRLSFLNRLNLQRVYLPSVRIQRRCPWTFPGTLAQRQEAVSGGTAGRFDAFYRCGYSADCEGGAGNLNGGSAFTTCDYSRAQCQERGMFATDSAGRQTARFGGIEFVPSLVQVRSYGESGSHVSPVLDNQARYNDYVPLIYGTAWFQPPVVFSRNDGNLTRTEVLLGMGRIEGVLKVVVNGIEIPAGQPGANMTATGWYNLVSPGERGGAFNPDFTDAQGNPLGDPYGSMAFMSVVVPNRIASGQSLPDIHVLVKGMRLDRYNSSGQWQDTSFTNNPAWVILDVLRRSGWREEEIDLTSFAATAEICDTPVAAVDLNGNQTLAPQFQCNLILNGRRSAADVVRGIRNGSSLYLVLSAGGLLQLKVEGSIAQQQPTLAPGSNSTGMIGGGWPAYEFGDSAFGGILRKPGGESSLRVYSRNSADTPNRMTVEFQDEFNEYQQDSISLVDVDDALLSGQEITTSLAALGLPNFNQAGRAITLQLNKSIRGNTYIDFETSVKAVGLNPGDLVTMTYAREGWERQLFRILRISPGPNFRTAVITAQIHDNAWYGPNALLGTSGSGRQPNSGANLPRPLEGAILDSSGNPQYAITEVDTQSADGSYTVNLTVGFAAPAKPRSSAAGIPLVGLNPVIQFTGGTLAGGQTLYYAVSALDQGGSESALSFLVAATIPAGTNTNAVTLQSLSFSPQAAGFNVYRGGTPQRLLRIATVPAITDTFTDAGLAPSLIPPPDANFDHANFYWRFERQPAADADVFSASTIGSSALSMAPNEFQSATVRIVSGAGQGQERQIASNSPTTITTATNWTVPPDSTSTFVVVDSSWQFGSTGSTSPVTFAVPDRPGMTVEISGRAATVRNEETDPLLSPITGWQIDGVSTEPADDDVAPAPSFGLSPTGEGAVELQAIGFSQLTNTKTISAGTLTLHFWDELKGKPSTTLSGGIGVTDTSIQLGAPGDGAVGGLAQIDSELVLVQSVSEDRLTYTVTRGAYGTEAADHAAGILAYDLTAKTFILPFVPGFFGSPASGSYSFPISLPDKRIAAAALFMTNARGNGAPALTAFTGTSDLGLRTLSGGQLTLQVEGPLAIQTNAAPPLRMESAHSVRDVFAMVKQAPNSTPIEVQITVNGQTYASVTIPLNQTISNIQDGFVLGPIPEGAQIGLNISSVSQTQNTSPGSDLTVTIRL